MCTKAADDSFIRKRGQSSSASFATSKGQGGMHNMGRALHVDLVISSMVILCFSLRFRSIKIMAIASGHKALENKTDFNCFDLMLPLFHMFCVNIKLLGFPK